MNIPNHNLEIVEYNGNQYVVFEIPYEQKNTTYQPPIICCIDYDDYIKIVTHNIYYNKDTNDNFVGRPYVKLNNRRIYLYNLIMDNEQNGRQWVTSIDHVNRNPLDNRQANLRSASRTEQRINQRVRINRDTIRMFVQTWLDTTENNTDEYVQKLASSIVGVYYSETKTHKRFKFDRKINGTRVIINSTSNSNATMTQKYQHMVMKIMKYNIDDELANLKNSLDNEFYEILKMAGFYKYKFNNEYHPTIQHIQNEYDDYFMIQYDDNNTSWISTTDNSKTTYEKYIEAIEHLNNIIEQISSKLDDVPVFQTNGERYNFRKYQQHNKSTQANRGIRFCVSRHHPTLKALRNNGNLEFKNDINTSGSQYLSINDKLDQLNEISNILENSNDPHTIITQIKECKRRYETLALRRRRGF